MYPHTFSTEKPEQDQVKTILDHPEFYLKNLAEYQKMLELLSVNEHLTELLNEDLSRN